MKTILYNPIFINPQAYYVFPRLTRYLQPDNESTAEPANYIGTIEVKVIAYGDTTLKRTYTNTDSIDLSEFKNTWIRISLFTKVGSCVLGEWKIGNMESDLPYIDPEVLASLKAVVIVGNKTNDDSDRAIVKNLVDPDNPFVISNAVYTEGSGYADKDSPYYGAFVTDGIDDLITSTKTVQEMLGGSNEITVVSMIHLVQTPSASSEKAYTNQIRTGQNYLRNYVTNNGKTGIYGYTYKGNNVSVINNILGDKNDYTVENKSWNNLAKFSVIGYEDNGTINELDQVAWYWTIIANKVLTTDQINQVIAYFNLDRTLKPDILCDVKKQGITNDNHAEFGDRLIDFSGNGMDIQLNNIAWKGDSGIGKYSADFGSFDWAVNISQKQHNKATISLNGRLCNHTAIEVDEMKVNIIGNVTELIYWYIANPDDTTRSEIRLTSGINTLPKSYAKDDGQTYNIGFAYISGDSEITIEQIPSHAGALFLDGVNDFGKVTGMPVYKDYTVVADYFRTKINISTDSDAPILSKAESTTNGAFMFNTISTVGEKVSYSFGTKNVILADDTERGIFYQSKYVNNGETIQSGGFIDSDKLWLGTYRNNDYRFFNGAIYCLLMFPYSMNKFLIERQLKKHKLGTLYPDMVEFRPVIKSNVLLDAKPTFVIRGTSTYLNAGDYVPENSQIWVSIKMNNIADRITKFTVNGKTIDIPENAYSEVTLQYGFLFVIDKSPQKISITIEQDENYVLFNPVINSNYDNYKLTFHLREYEKLINIGDYIPKGTYIRANLYLKNDIDELVTFTFNGVNIDYAKSSVLDTAYNIRQIYNYDSPQEVNITIDEYIRYEDIVQPYPVLLRFNDENGNEVSWGGKFKVGSTITRMGSIADPESNLLNGLYSISGLSLNGKAVTSSTSIVEKQMVFKTIATYLLDNNEPKCILSPRLLRIPNSSYKILGYIPDISGHGNHGVIHNSAYAEGSGVNEDGSYQLDGVDDFVTIPTVAGKQVLMKLNWQNKALGNLIYDQRDNNSTSFAIMPVSINDSTNNKIAYQARNANGITYIDGIRNEYIKSYSLKNINHNITITNPNVSNKTVALGASNRTTADYFAKYALYDFMLFDEISTDNKIKELNEYVGIEAKVELPPYYWDTYGKTNLDADKATIQQRGVAVGDYDLTNYNHAYDKMSGYGGYKFAKFDNELDWYLTPDNGYIDVVSRNGYSITLRNLSTSNYGWYFQNSTVKEFITKDIPFKVKANKSIRVYWDMHSYKSNGENFGYVVNNITLNPNEDTSINLRHLTEEELTELDANKDRMYYLLWFDLSTLVVDEEVTIEMLPLYPNGLLYDGVTDYSENVNIPTFNDFTLLVKASLLNGFIGSGGSIAKKGNNNKVIGGGYDFIYALDSSTIEDNRNSYWSFGAALRVSNGAINPPLIGYMTKNNVNGVPMSSGANPSIEGITFSKWEGYIKMVLYKAMLYPKTIPLLQINFLKNLMEKDEIIDLNNKIFIQE